MATLDLEEYAAARERELRSVLRGFGGCEEEPLAAPYAMYFPEEGMRAHPQVFFTDPALTRMVFVALEPPDPLWLLRSALSSWPPRTFCPGASYGDMLGEVGSYGFEGALARVESLKYALDAGFWNAFGEVDEALVLEPGEVPMVDVEKRRRRAALAAAFGKKPVEADPGALWQNAELQCEAYVPAALYTEERWRDELSGPAGDWERPRLRRFFAPANAQRRRLKDVRLKDRYASFTFTTYRALVEDDETWLKNVLVERDCGSVGGWSWSER